MGWKNFQGYTSNVFSLGGGHDSRKSTLNGMLDLGLYERKKKDTSNVHVDVDYSYITAAKTSSWYRLNSTCFPLPIDCLYETNRRVVNEKCNVLSVWSVGYIQPVKVTTSFTPMLTISST